MTAAAPSTTHAPTVLVADDDEDILALVSLRLQRSGYSVLTARDGRAALALARERRPDLAVLDVSMPELTGVEVTRALRSDDPPSDMPVILLTARVAEADVQTGLDAGATDYIMKPFSPQDLRSCVEAALAQR